MYTLYVDYVRHIYVSIQIQFKYTYNIYVHIFVSESYREYMHIGDVNDASQI